MPGWLERYLAGERELVWEELQEVGGATSDEPTYADALAVANETMRRARVNIEILVARLSAVGYHFGPYWWDTPAYQALRSRQPGVDMIYPSIFAPPKPTVEEQKAELEHLGGVLPLSLRAWYMHVGSVCLVGEYPVDDPSDPGGFTSYMQYMRSKSGAYGFTERPSAQVWQSENEHDLDPLYVNPIEHALQQLRRWGRMYGDRRPFVVLAPDEHFKYGVSGGGSYDIVLPNPKADAPMEGEWHRTNFVNYLRICFRWGGFPGLGTKNRPPRRELEHLTHDLLPI